MEGLSDRARAWASDGKKFVWQGHNIFYKVAGRGPAMLLIHGYPVGSYDWHSVWNQLAADFSVVTLDALGYGFSVKPNDADYSLGAQVALYEAFLAQYLKSGAHVIAHDVGVTIAQEMLASRIHNKSLPPLHTVVFLNGAICPRAYKPRIIQRLLVSRVGGVIGPRIPKSAFRTAIGSLFSSSHPPKEEMIEDFWHFVQHNQGQQITHKVGAIWNERIALSEHLESAILKTRTPTMFINGNADPNSGIHMMNALERLKPDAKISHLKSIGHWPQIEAPVRTVEELRSFHSNLMGCRCN